MAGNSFGTLFRISTYGESHGHSVGVVIDGCPPSLSLSEDDIVHLLRKRRPGQSAIVTQRKEDDYPHILSGVFEGKTTGTPIHIQVVNKNAKSKDYSHIKETFRPSHADFTYQEKYGIRDYRGGGRSSARETVARVAAGAVAMKYLSLCGVRITAFVKSVKHITLDDDFSRYNIYARYDNDVRCPDKVIALEMEQLIRQTRKDGDTVGGIISCVIEGVPVGLGEPAFDKLHAELGKAILSINACKGFEIGSGFHGTKMYGSKHNDRFIMTAEGIRTETNNSGGVQGGISNGMPIVFNCAFKPVATIMQDQKSVDKDGNTAIVSGKGRHDPCVLPRAVPIVESMTALVIMDYVLMHKAYKEKQ